MSSLGTLRHRRAYGGNWGQTVEEWQLDVQPHLRMKLKRLFPRVSQGRRGTLTITDTPEVARDLEWVLQRWPLELDDPARERLTNRAQEHRDHEQGMAAILRGQQGRLHLLREPARPARDYQRVAGDAILHGRRLLLADEVGLGKTQSAILPMLDPDLLPAVVVTLTHLPEQWCEEIAAVAPWLSTHVAKRTTPYGVDCDVLVMGYSKLDGWADVLAGQVRYVVFDEVQELRRPNTKKYVAAGLLADRASHVVGLSATPVYNYGDEAHTILDVLSPGSLGSRTEFTTEWGAHQRTNGQVVIADPNALGTYLREQGLLLRRTRTDVGRELPDIVRVTQHVDVDMRALDDVAVEVADLARSFLDGDARDRWQTAGEMDWKLRQATGLAKAAHVAAFVRLLLESEQAVVLFGWHRAVYERWQQLLDEFNPLLYTGSESPQQKMEHARRFRAGESRVLIVSLRSGAGLNGLQDRARVCVFGELDWSPAMHEQCEGRLRRDGASLTEPVVSYFLVADEGSDPAVAEVLGVKRGQAEPIMDPDATPLATADGSADRMRLLAEQYLDKHAQGRAL